MEQERMMMAEAVEERECNVCLTYNQNQLWQQKKNRASFRR